MTSKSWNQRKLWWDSIQKSSASVQLRLCQWSDYRARTREGAVDSPRFWPFTKRKRLNVFLSVPNFSAFRFWIGSWILNTAFDFDKIELIWQNVTNYFIRTVFQDEQNERLEQMFFLSFSLVWYQVIYYMRFYFFKSPMFILIKLE